ncbi:hypothetical protein, partial [Pseudomonas viridiflava]|uniref:hypothetical protein n=1 Tax=Pseudomonas viridiflava TaxID=33069 RepID=UPI00197FE8D0
GKYSQVINSRFHSKPEQVKTVTKQPFAAVLCRTCQTRQNCFPQLHTSAPRMFEHPGRAKKTAGF